METAFRKLFQILISSAIQRCRLSESPCRLTVSLKCFHDSNPPSVRISISDTGVGSSLVEFQDLVFASFDKWDGVLSITTTGIHDKDIQHYRLNVREAISSGTRLTRLPSTCKNVGSFSGTEVCTSNMEVGSVGDLVSWVVLFVQKILIVKVPNIAVEVLVDNIKGSKSRCECILQETADDFVPTSMSNIERFVSGLENYVLRHDNVLSKECQSCFPTREHLKVGSGVSYKMGSSSGIGHGQITEAVILIAADSSQTCTQRMSCSTTQVIYYHDFTPCSIPQSSIDALTSINWQTYGLKLSGIHLDTEGHAMIEWENEPLFSQITIGLHSYGKRIRQSVLAERNHVKKAVKIALDNLKAKHKGLFLSTQGVKIRDYALDLSRSIAGLIISSKDLGFQDDCAALLGLCSVDAGKEERIEACIREKIVDIIESNDGKQKIHTDIAPCLFECDPLFEEDCLNEDGGAEDVSMLDI